MTVVSWTLRSLLVVCVALGRPADVVAQTLPTTERELLTRQLIDRGGPADQVATLLAYVDGIGGRDLPIAPLTNKIREGLAKSVELGRIETVVRQLGAHLEMADRIIREARGGLTAADRAASTALLADALGGGVTPDDVRELGRLPQVSGAEIPAAVLASAAKGLAFIRSAKLPASDGTAVVAEAARRGFRAQELLDLGREIRRRETDYQTGRASLKTLRDAIARGERPDQLFPPLRPAPVVRPAATRPEPPATRPAPPVRPETPQRPSTPERPPLPERPATGR